MDGLRGAAALAVVVFHVHLHDLLGVRAFATHVGWAAANLHAGRTVTSLAGLVLAIAFALAMDRRFDAPVRAWLARRQAPAGPVQAVSPA